MTRDARVERQVESDEFGSGNSGEGGKFAFFLMILSLLCSLLAQTDIAAVA
jgi:hypothetical protein